jgi:two-component sensor histidine kinase
MSVKRRRVADHWRAFFGMPMPERDYALPPQKSAPMPSRFASDLYGLEPADKLGMTRTIDEAYLQGASFRNGDEGEFRLELENASLRKLLAQAGANAAKRDNAERLQRLILEELHHRVKNTLAIVQAITSQSLRTAVDTRHASEAISARISALGRVHDLLLRTNWSGVMLPELLKAAVEPFDSVGGGQFRISPAQIEINAVAALPFVMTINELCTNATKHGALSVSEGRVEIMTDVNEGRGTFHFRWTEENGPLVMEPKNRSFGMRLIEKGFAEQFSGSARMQFKPSGVVCEIDVPIATIQYPAARQ